MSLTLDDPRLRGQAIRRVVYSSDEIAARVRELGAEITRAYPDGDLLLVLGLLKGSFIFVSDLVRQISRPLQVDFLVAASYGSGHGLERRRAAGVRSRRRTWRGSTFWWWRMSWTRDEPLGWFMDVLQERRPASLEVCALLDKHVSTYLKHPPRFVGFEAPNEFLVGYGLDHAENFRHLPYIASLQ